MATSSQKTPPVLNDDVNYADWKMDVNVWKMFTQLEDDKQGPALYLSLNGKARDCVRELSLEDIGGENGFQLIIDKLDKIFEDNVNLRTFTAFKSFYDFRRPSDMGMKEFIIKYEGLYHKLQEFNLTLPDGVQCFFFLIAANISEENERLARVTCANLTYEDMKETLFKIFNDPGGGQTTKDDNIPAIKQEPVFKVTHKNRGEQASSYRYRNDYDSSRKKNVQANRGYNIKDAEGNIMRCFKCGSEKHFARECPKWVDSEKKYHQKSKEKQPVYITLFSSSKVSGFLKESLGMAVLDTGCSRTLVGEIWLKEYYHTLSEKEMQLVKSYPTKTSYVFGDGEEVKSRECVEFPVYIGSQMLKIKADVVSSEIPLLMGRPSMVRGRINIFVSEKEIEILGERVGLVQTSTGHLCLPLTNKLLMKDYPSSIILNTTCLKNCSLSEKKQKAIKLHKQFSHPSKERLLSFVKNSRGFRDKDFLKCIEECTDNCQICLEFKRPKLRPIVAFPLGNKFNDVVCLDLKEIVHNKSYILHLIDSTTRYSAAKVIYSKNQNEIIQAVFSIWIAYFGSPRMFLTDNGGEFNNAAFREMNEKLNIVTATTAAECGFSNGIVERHHLVIAEAMEKTIKDEKCSEEMALSWAISAKNALSGYGGISPNMMVFGNNTNVPSVLHDKLPALETNTVNDVVRNNINAQHVARKKYIEAESSAKIKRALKSKVRNYNDVNYSVGEKVFYRRKHSKQWQGPATVIGQDSNVVMCRHGGQLIRCHPCHLMKDHEYQLESKPNANKQFKRNKSKRKPTVTTEKDSNTSSDSESEYSDEYDPNESVDTEHDESVESEQDESVESNESIENTNVEQEQAINTEENVIRDGKVIPKRNSYVKYKIHDSEDWKRAKILSLQPKKGGRYKNYVNLENEGEDPKGVVWSEVKEWCEIQSPENVVLLSKHEELSQEVVDAKHKEVENLKLNNVYKEVPYTGQKTISSRWVFSEKMKEDGRKVKARLVARGFEEQFDIRKDSPTCSREANRMVYLTAVSMSWEVESLDFSSAFLQGEQIERNIFLKPPSDICDEDKVWQMKKCIYGLRDAPRSWYKKVNTSLIELGGKRCAYDDALFIWHNENGQLIGVIASHVDDFLFTGDKTFHKQVINQIKVQFKIGQESKCCFKYIGLSVVQNKNSIKIDQNQYISKIEKIDIPSDRSLDSQLTECEKLNLKRLAGKMLWVSSNTRPDISFETCVMSNTGQAPTLKMIHEANKAVSKLKSKSYSIKFKNIGSPSNFEICVFTDATHNSLGDGSSQGGYIVFIKGQNGEMVPISWKSKKLHRVTKSPLASETSALGEGADAGYLISSMVKEIFGLSSSPPITCFTDSCSLVQHLHTTKLSTDLRLRVDISRMREMVKNNEMAVKWCSSKMQLSDCLTKKTASTNALIKIISS